MINYSVVAAYSFGTQRLSSIYTRTNARTGIVLLLVAEEDDNYTYLTYEALMEL